jgi:hypothetical protein
VLRQSARQRGVVGLSDQTQLTRLTTTDQHPIIITILRL